MLTTTSIHNTNSPSKLQRERQLLELTSTRAHWFRYHMPYVFEPLNIPNTKHVYLPLNRNYKPLGCLFKDHVDYHRYAASHAMQFRRNPEIFYKVWHYIAPDGKLFMYDDGLQSRIDYFERLGRLLTRSMWVLGEHGKDFDCHLRNDGSIT
jgi:hypothetical protein